MYGVRIDRLLQAKFRDIYTPQPLRIQWSACAELMQEEMVMSGQLDEITRHLNAHQVLNIRNGQGLRVGCLRGVLWITQSNDSDDIVVQDGQSFVLDRPGLALISAPIGPADIIIQPASRGRSNTIGWFNQPGTTS
jgi:Protein of unknown function (DUF2917)